MKASLQDIKQEKIIAIIRGVPSDFIIETAKALVSGGIHMMEITFDQESPEGIKNTLDSLTILNEQMHDEIALGAGTVLTAEQVELAYERGAGYVISPNVDQDVIQKTKELGYCKTISRWNMGGRIHKGAVRSFKPYSGSCSRRS